MPLSNEELLKLYENKDAEGVQEKLVRILLEKVDNTLERAFHGGISHGTLYESKYLFTIYIGRE